MVQGLLVHCRGNLRVDEKRLNLRRKHPAGRGSRVVQRLLAKAIPREEDASGAAVVYQEREHAVQPIQASVAILEIEASTTSVSQRVINRWPRRSRSAGARVVVNLAVVNDRDIAIGR